MPGDLTTTSNAESASALTCVDACSCGSPSAATSTASFASQKTVSASEGNRERNARYAARPSRPQPHSATRRPSSEEMRTQGRPQRGRDAVFVVELEQRRQFEFARVELRPDLARETLDQRVLAPLRSRGERGHRGARFATFTDAFERLVVLEFQQRVVTALLRRVVEQVAAEDAD